MADSFIQLSPDSTGKRVDTRTAPDGDHREVNVIGSPTTADVAEADAANGLDVDVTRVQGSVAVTNAGLTALAGAIAGTEVQVDIVSGGSAGVQYTEDDAAPANPVGTALAMVRDDVLSGQTTADGDIVAARSTDKGELYVKHVDAVPVTDNGGVLTVDGTVAVTNADLTAIAASASVLDDWDETNRAAVNTIAGQVGVQGGSGTINALTQRVVLATDQPTVPVSLAAGGTTQYAEDTAHSSGDLVTLAGVVQQTADAALSSDGDRSVLQVDATGFAKVNVKSSALPTGASTSANQVTELASLAAIESDADAIRIATQLIDDTVQVLGTDVYTEATSKGITLGAVRRDADTTLVGTTNEFGPLQMDANGRLKVEAFSGETLPVSLTSTTITGAVDTELPAAAALADNTANPTVPAVGSFLMAFDGTNWDRVQTGAAATGSLKVDGSAVTQPVSGTVTANAGTNLNTSALALESGGNLATAVASLSVLDDWDETDRAKVNLIAGQVGVAGDAGVVGATVQRVVQANGAGKTILSAGGSASSSGNNTLIAAGTNRLKVAAFSLTTLSTTAMTCIFQSGAGGTELWRVIIQAPASVSAGANLATAIPGWLFATASATLLNLNLSSANAVHWSVSYYDEA